MTFDSSKIQESAEYFSKIWSGKFDAAVVLGSGLNDILSGFEIQKEISFSDIPNIKTSRVQGHSNKFLIARHSGKTVLIMQGRVHLYEGHSAFEVSLPAAMMAELGVTKLILTNAAGGINPDFKTGDIMAITDHINLQGTSPLRGIRDSSKFLDLTGAWNTDFLAELKEKLGIREGVYAGLSGPNYETPAEIRYLRTIGADTVGMSTIMEAIMARYCKMKLFGFSMITNMAAGMQKDLSHTEVIDVGRKAGKTLLAAVELVLNRL